VLATPGNLAKAVTPAGGAGNASSNTQAPRTEGAAARPSNATGTPQRRSTTSKIRAFLQGKLPAPPAKHRWLIFAIIGALLLALSIFVIAGGLGPMIAGGTLLSVIRLYGLFFFLGLGLGRTLVDIVFPKLNKQFGWKLPANSPTGRDKPAWDAWSWVHHLTGWMLGFFTGSLWPSFLFVVAATMLWEAFEWSGPSGLGDEESNGNRATDLTLAWAGFFLARLVMAIVMHH
jgi:hypothetical protein